MLNVGDYRRLLDVVRACAEAEEIEDFRAVALRSIRAHLGYERLTFYLGMHPAEGLALRDPVSLGLPQADPSGSADTVMVWLDTGLPVHGYLGVLACGDLEFDRRTQDLFGVLAPHLAYLLRAHLRRNPQPDTATLTLREQQVARLAADGWSNRAIARHLDIGEATVKKHITRVLTKSDVRSRTELAALWRLSSC